MSFKPSFKNTNHHRGPRSSGCARADMIKAGQLKLKTIKSTLKSILNRTGSQCNHCTSVKCFNIERVMFRTSERTGAFSCKFTFLDLGFAEPHAAETNQHTAGFWFSYPGCSKRADTAFNVLALAS